MLLPSSASSGSDELMDVPERGHGRARPRRCARRARPCSLRPRSHQGHPVRRADRSPADAGSTRRSARRSRRSTRRIQSRISPSSRSTSWLPPRSGSRQRRSSTPAGPATERPASWPSRRRRATTRSRLRCSTSSWPAASCCSRSETRKGGRATEQPRSRRFRDAAELAERAGLAQHLARAALGYGGRFAWARASTDPALVPLLERALAAIGDEDSLVGSGCSPASPPRDVTTPRAIGEPVSVRRHFASRVAPGTRRPWLLPSRVIGSRWRARTSICAAEA